MELYSRVVEHKDRLMTTELRYTLFNLLSSWSQSLGYMYAANNAMSWYGSTHYILTSSF